MSPQQEELVAVFQFQSEQQQNRFERLYSTIYVVSEEQVVLGVNIAVSVQLVSRSSVVLEQSHQIAELAIQVAEYFYLS